MSGITTFADTGDTGAGFDAMLERSVRGICYREVFGPDPSQCDDAIAGLGARVMAMRLRATPLVHVGVSPHAPYTVSDALFRATGAFARTHDLPIAVHIAESEIETALIAHGRGPFAAGLNSRGIDTPPRARSPVELLETLEILDLQPLLIHCIRVDKRDIAAIKAHDCAVAHCPASNAKLGHGIAPLADLLRAHVRVGLGTDSVASNDRMDILDEARVAALLSNAREQHHGALSAGEALRLATWGGAEALGLADEIGTLTVGKSADLAAFSLPQDRAPVHDPTATAIFGLAGARAALTVVAGRVLVRNATLVDVDEGLPRRVQDSADRLQDWLAAQQADLSS